MAGWSSRPLRLSGRRVLFVLVLVVLAGLLVGGVLASVGGTATVSTTLSESGELTVNAVSPGSVRVTCKSDQVRVNGDDLEGAGCADVTALLVIGDAELDLAPLSDPAFTRLASLRVEGMSGEPTLGLRRAGEHNGAILWGQLPEALKVPAQESGQKVPEDGSRLTVPDHGALGINAPPLTDTIDAADFNDNGSQTGFFFIPPDPIAAAGPNHVVNVVNVLVEWFDKPSGANRQTQSLANFFSGLPGPLPTTFTFDPKVIYDQYNDRFVVITLEQTAIADLDPADTSYIFVAVSDDSNPNGTWYLQAIDAKANFGGTDYWADYPGLAVDDEAVYITNNMFTFGTNNFGRTRLWVLDKDAGSGGGLYNGGTSNVGVYDPDVASGQPAGSSFTLQPAHMFGTAQGSTGTFLTEYSGLTSAGNEFLRVIRIDNATGSPSWDHQFVPVGNIDNTAVIFLPDAPQLGTATDVEVNDRRSLHSVWRDNNLYVVAEVLPPSGNDAGETTAHWFRVDTSTLGSLSLADQGNVSGDDIAADTYTFFPSIAVDKDGNFGIGFAASASSIYPGAYYTCKATSDPAGTVQSSGTLAAGLDYYVRTFGGPRNRWGDYSGIALDPTNETTFWVYNEYAKTRGNLIGGEDGRWSTRYGSFACPASGGPMPTPTPPPSAFNNLPIIVKNYDATNVVADGGFEDGVPNAFWNEFSTNFGTPICDVATCGVGNGTGPHSGLFWTWFGGIGGVAEIGSVDQSVTIPAGSATLTFWLEIPAANTTGNMEVRIDGNTIFSVTHADAPSYPTYQQVALDVSAYADGGSHTLSFNSTTNAGGGALNFFVDDVALTP